METYKAKQQDLAERKVEVFEHYCKHRQGPEEICDAQELAKRLGGKDAVVIKGIYDEEHLRIYRDAVAIAGLNQLLVKVVDYRWNRSAVDNAVAALQANWVAELSHKVEKMRSSQGGT